MLERALKLRDDGKYTEAGVCLLKASQDNPEAMYHLSIAYRHGGWGLEKNVELAKLYLDKSANAGFTLAQIQNGTFKGAPITPIERAYCNPSFEAYFELAKEGNEFAQYRLTEYTVKQVVGIWKTFLLCKNAYVCGYFGFAHHNFLCTYNNEAKRLLYIAHEQKCFVYSESLYHSLLYQHDLNRAFKVGIQSRNVHCIENFIGKKYKSNKLSYLLGKWINRSINPRHKSTNEHIRCLEFYRNTIQETKSVVYAWSLCAKQLGVCKDITQMIGRFIWKLKSKDL